jgi:hypothetical protein
VALVENILYRFFLLLIEGEDGGAYESSFSEIVPSEDVVLDYDP